MKVLKQVLGAAVFLTIFALPVRAEGMSHQFSAEMSMTSAGHETRAKFYVGNNKVRMEMPQGIMISRMDKGVSWMLMPEQNMYMEHPLDRKMAIQGSEKFPGEMSRVSQGKEEVSGRPAEKFLVRYDDGQGAEDMLQWLGEDGIPVKMASVDGSWSVEYQYIQPGPQPDSLFEIPAGYQKMEVPNMQNMMAAAAQEQS